MECCAGWLRKGLGWGKSSGASVVRGRAKQGKVEQSRGKQGKGGGGLCQTVQGKIKIFRCPAVSNPQ